MKEGLYMKGTWNIKHIRNGKVLQDDTIHNRIVNAGLNELIDGAFVAGGTTQFKYVALGSGTAATAAGTTALTTEHSGNGLARDEADSATRTGTGIATITKTFTCSADDQSVYEVGLFDTAVTGGNLMCRVSSGDAEGWSGIADLDTNDQVAVTITITIAYYETSAS
ncbi:MAG: hypothetical protein JXB46_00975 [Candidatus Eisenbacteria bacterium]|nr:hypothetical protein [Candidatus Eisenbacteria bacterium]